MESSNQGTEGETNSRQQTLEKGTIKKTTVKTKIRKLIENSREEKAARETAKSQKYKEIHEKKRCHCLDFTICLSYSFLQLLDLQKKEDKNSNKADKKRT
jgi:hypothetical protein